MELIVHELFMIRATHTQVMCRVPRNWGAPTVILVIRSRESHYYALAGTGRAVRFGMQQAC